MRAGSIHLYHKEVGYLPELCRISDLDNFLPIHIYDLIGVFGLACHHLSLLAVGRYLSESALVGILEIIHIEIALHHFGFAEES